MHNADATAYAILAGITLPTCCYVSAWSVRRRSGSCCCVSSGSPSATFVTTPSRITSSVAPAGPSSKHR